MERDFSIEKLKYQENKFAYNLALIAFLSNQVYLVQVLDNTTKDFNLGIEIFINLGMYMFLFLGMERVKNHHRNWSIGFIVMGCAFFLRIFYLPLNILKLAKDLEVIADTNSMLVAGDLRTAALIAIVSISIAGILIIISGIHGYKQSVTIKNYYERLELN